MEIITPQEKQALQDKLDQLKARRPDITNRIAEARALGDLSENAEYHAARDDQALDEAEIRRLEARIKESTVASEDETPDDMVFVGSVVRLRDTEDDSDDLYKLVGEATGNFDTDEIEVTTGSPMGEALFKARQGETITVDLPRGTKRFEVLELP